MSSEGREKMTSAAQLERPGLGRGIAVSSKARNLMVGRVEVKRREKTKTRKENYPESWTRIERSQSAWK